MTDQSLSQYEQKELLVDEHALEDKTISFRQGDWQWNAAVCGFINIVGRENVTVDASGDICVSQELLKGFEEAYFRYFIKTYLTTFSLDHIRQFKASIDRHEDSDFEDFCLNDLKILNAYIRNVKKYLTSNSYGKAFAQMIAGQELVELEKELSTLREPKNDVAFTVAKDNLLPNVREKFSLLQQVIKICYSDEAKREIGARNAIYNIINKGWKGVSFLNRKPVEADVYADYHSYFVEPALADLNSDHSKHKFRCFSCGTPMANMDNDLSFLVATGFDVGKKSSHVWNHSNDVAVCPICRLVYSCLPAGIGYAFNNGIYINVQGLDQAQQVNSRLCHDLLANRQKQPSVYRAVMQALQKQISEGYQYDMADVQVVKYEKDDRTDKSKYRFNILSRSILNVVAQSTEMLENLSKAFFSQDDNRYQVYDEIADRILESRNLFTLLHRILYSTLNPKNQHNFRSHHALQVLQINQRLLNTLGGVSNMSDEFVRDSQSAGYHLRSYYLNKKAEDKIPGICYRLLNALKTGNSNMFLDVALNCYLYVGKTVPAVFTKAIGKDTEFSTMGYAFVSGLIMNRSTGNKTEGGETKIETEIKED